MPRSVPTAARSLSSETTTCTWWTSPVRAERALTTGGTETLRHGVADWVYFEEIYNRRWPGFWWSPDSKRIALMEYDDAPVGTLTMLNDTSSPRKVEQNKYPRAGEPNPKVRLGIVDAGGGAVRWADLSGYSSGAFLISQVGWWADSKAALRLHPGPDPDLARPGEGSRRAPVTEAGTAVPRCDEGLDRRSRSDRLSQGRHVPLDQRARRLEAHVSLRA